jgi:hypothetical protein
MGYIFDIKFNKESFMIKLFTIFGFGISYGCTEEESTVTISFCIWRYWIFLTTGYLE